MTGKNRCFGFSSYVALLFTSPVINLLSPVEPVAIRSTSCANVSCENAGICSQDGVEGIFQCLCEHGYDGQRCENKILCANDTCKHGACTQDGAKGVYKCTCEDGYEGVTCEGKNCGEALGMESGDIKDNEITASSSYSEELVGPQHGRLGRELNGGAWCPVRQIGKNVHEYLEISLATLHVLTAVATQGRYGNGRGREYAEEYILEYKRPGLSDWVAFQNREEGVNIFEGNNDTYTIVKRIIDPPITTKEIRFVPYSIRYRTVCMRVEIYGCPLTGTTPNSAEEI